MTRLKDRVAIITGAARGIGFACAKLFAEEGAKVAIADVLDEAGEDSAALLGRSGHTAAFVHCDVRDRGETAALVAKTVERFGRVDICVCNAGIARAADFLDVSLEDWNAIIAVNLTGAFLVGQAAARQMVRQGQGGAIVHISSVEAVVAHPPLAPYVVSKGGVGLLTRVMAVSLADKGIRVNAVGPGSIRTEMLRVVALDKKLRAMQMSRTPLGRYGEPEEIAHVALFLASDESSYVTGQTIYADGGRLALHYTVPVRDDV